MANVKVTLVKSLIGAKPNQRLRRLRSDSKE